MKARIVMATHNPSAALLTRQIASLIAQTERDWQCLIFDDNSTDRDAVRSMLTDARLHLLPPTSRLGAYLAFEHLLKAANDVAVFLCDQDDTWHPEKISTMLSVPGTVFSAMRVVDEAGHVVRERFLPPPDDLSPAGLLLMNCVSGTALKISPRTRRAALPFPAPQLRGWHDQWLAAVAARLGELIYLDEVLVDYTQHSAQVVGDGLRHINRRRMKQFVQRPDLRSRTDWVRAAAHRLLQIDGPRDPDLEAIAAGRFREVLRSHDVPWQRGVLLTAGRWL